MRVAVFGLGYVGAVSSACLADIGHNVIGVDVNDDKVAMINAGEAPIVEEKIAEVMQAAAASGRLHATTDAASAVANSDIALVSVGTPTGEDGAPDFTYMDMVLRQIGNFCRDRVEPYTVVIRSTVTPGATRARFAPLLSQASGKTLGNGIDIVVNPEFLREGKSVSDFRTPPFTIIGAMSDSGFSAVASLYDAIPGEVVRTEPEVAEAIKIVSNAWHGLKVGFANEVGRALAAGGIDSRDAMAVFVRDKVLNISPAYLRPGFAFGGSCLPKDLRALIDYADRSAVTVPILRATLASNQDHINRAVERVRRHGRKSVALFGLAFKPGTDDLRESPLVALAERLIGKGYPLRIYDAEVDTSRLLGKNKAFIEREIPHFVELLAPSAVDALADTDVIIFGHGGADVIEAVRQSAGDRPVIDLAGNDNLAGLAGYEGICW